MANADRGRYALPMEPNLRADRFAVVIARIECHGCHAETPVTALLVPAYSEFDGEGWTAQDDSALLRHVQAVDGRTLLAWTQRAPWVRPLASTTAGLTYLANVCACGALQGDYYLAEQDGPFFPQSAAGIAAIDVEWIEAPIEPMVGASESSWMDDLVERSPYVGWTPRPQPKPRRERGVSDSSVAC
jgi:uncharacterized Fe-S cluster protein YjdI